MIYIYIDAYNIYLENLWVQGDRVLARGMEGEVTGLLGEPRGLSPWPRCLLGLAGGVFRKNWECLGLWGPQFYSVLWCFLIVYVCLYFFFLIFFNIFCITCFTCIAICCVFNLVLWILKKQTRGGGRPISSVPSSFLLSPKQIISRLMASSNKSICVSSYDYKQHIAFQYPRMINDIDMVR